MSDVCLVQMPYSMLYTPSLALGILKSRLIQSGFSCKVFYGDITFADALGYETYAKLLNKRIIYLFAEMSFADTVWSPIWHTNSESHPEPLYRKYLEEIVYPLEGESYAQEYEDIMAAAQNVIPEYLKQLAGDILKENPLIVGCSSNFQQNNASFAILREIKKAAPQVITIMGGSNCALEAGQAIASNVEWIDYTFSGEGEASIPDFCRLVRKYGKDIPTNELPDGVMSARTADKKPLFPITMNLNDIPLPDFTDYFEQTDKTPWFDRNQISLTAESSRGCWWREKQGCTFCGLCMENVRYRRKDTELFLQELLTQSKRYGIKRFFLTDSILSNEMLSEFPKLVAALPENPQFLLFAEVKSNMSLEELRNLKNAGFHTLQPGIEAIQDDLLMLMNKGNRAIRHIEFLKNAQQCKMKLSWNLLFDFPHEDEKWVEDTLNMIPALTHLPPPNGAMSIIYQKYSHYYEHSKDYGLNLKGLPAYNHIYGFHDALAGGTAYNFYLENCNNLKSYYKLKNKGGIYELMANAVSDWITGYYNDGDCMQMLCYSDRLEIMDLRGSAKHSYYELREAEKELYLFCDSPKKEQDILAHMDRTGTSKAQTKHILEKMLDNLLLLKLGEEYLALAVRIDTVSYERT